MLYEPMQSRKSNNGCESRAIGIEYASCCCGRFIELRDEVQQGFGGSSENLA